MNARAALLVLLLYAPSAFGAPAIAVVTGTLPNLTITGSAFSTKGVAAPLKFDDFETGTPGVIVTNGWARSAAANTPGTPHFPDYSTAVLRTNSTRSVRCRFDEATAPAGCPPEDGCQYESSIGVSGNSGEVGYTAGLTLPVIYIDAWMYYAPSTPLPRNFKLMRVHANTYTPNLFFNIWCATNSDVGIIDEDGSVGGSCYNPPYTCGWFPDTPDRHSDTFWQGNWRHIQAYFVESSPNVANGTATVTIDNVPVLFQGTSNSRVGNLLTRTDAGQHWDTLWLGNYMGHGSDAYCAASPGNSYSYWDDAYVDTTRAHVELGDAATYAGCTHREVQVPTSWSATSINITARRGSFSGFTGLYLYVMDKDGNVNSAGYQLPSAPTGGNPCTPF